MEKYEIAILSVITGAILGFLGTFFNTKIAYCRQQKNVASSLFEEAFVEEMVWCLSKEEFRIKEKLSSSLIKHHKAVILFEAFLNSTEKEQLRRAWSKYCHAMEYQIINEYIPEAGIGREGYVRELGEREQRELILSHYKNIVSFSKLIKKY